VLGEDSFLAREGVVSALEAIDEVELVGACGDLDELRSTHPDAGGRRAQPARRAAVRDGESEDVSKRVKAVLLYLNGSLQAAGTSNHASAT